MALPDAADHRLSELARSGDGPDLSQSAPHQADWKALFQTLVRTLPADGAPAMPAMPEATQAQITQIRTGELHKLKRDFGFDLADFGLSY